MAAEIKSQGGGVGSSASGGMEGAKAGVPKPELVHKLEGCTDEVNGAVLIPGEQGVISISSDRSVRVWLLRDSGQFWPSVCHYMPAAATSMSYTHATRQLFVGLESGVVEEFTLARDYNRLDSSRVYHAHDKARVSDVVHTAKTGWILSGGRDKYFHYHCVNTGKRLGGYLCNAWVTSIAYDEQAQYVFIGDYSGAITVCHLEAQGLKFINTLKGHSGSVRTLAWDGTRNWLYSGSFDCSVFVWDIGGRKGTVYELHGHRSKVTALAYSGQHSRLLSTGEDSRLVCWNMEMPRLETPDWAESDNCQLCNKPFFWNLKSMYDQKQIGLRQHHCRKCGKAICDYCSSKRSTLTDRGHEYPVRVCENCYITITDHEKTPRANFFDTRHIVKHMSYDTGRQLLATVGQDHVIKIWNMKTVLEGSSMAGP